ncbi:MAG TPA: malate/lactate/ureidoglycolate dehydrogenase [Alphaproteobacteria bacterium]|nr:malate/lactate/ureidoglycolate dehydrogenase [Alphaproteobacteria bacterium]
MRIDHQELSGIGERIVTAGGSAPEEARLVVHHLVEANLRGHDSHGIGMLPRYVQNLKAGTLIPNRRGRVVKEDGAFITYDGERGYGQVVAREATLRGIARARQEGIAVVALRNAHHIGRVGTYGELCAEAGLVSVHFVNVIGHGGLVAPHRGRDARLSTNPVCIAVPAAEPGRPIVLDMATSKVAMGKVRVAKNQGKTLPPGLLLDARGEPSTDPNALFGTPHGAILPFAEHKGYALAFICELLAGAVAGGGTLRPENQTQDTITNCMLSFVLDPARLVAQDWLKAEIAAITAWVTASPPRDPAEPVLIPGDPERQSRASRLRDGIPLDEATWKEIVQAAASLGLALGKGGVAA